MLFRSERISIDLRAGCAFVHDIYMQLARANLQDVDAILERAVKDAKDLWLK